MTANQAVRAGLVSELMTVVVQPPPPAPAIIPTKLSGSYQLGEILDAGNFMGYEFVVKQEYLNANSISGKFDNTEEFLKFADELKNAGINIQLQDDFTGIVRKYTANEAINDRLIFGIRYGKTEVQGSFEVSEGVAKIKQQPFRIGKNFDKAGAFKTANDLFEFIEKCLEDLNFFDQVQKMYTRQGYELKRNEDYSERSLDRNRDFHANPEKYLQMLENSRSKYLSSRFFNFGKMF